MPNILPTGIGGARDNRHHGYFPAVPTRRSNRKPELLAPAGGPDAGYAALEYGADAIYLGLRSFSARADAENFSLDELSDITGYAHSLMPRRRVFVTFNTLVFDRELDVLLDSLAAVADIGVDAVVVQDLGVAHIVRNSFPALRLHASTQLAIHNLAGVHVARDLGFQRVTLARELTLIEIRSIAAQAGIEVETFVHGALCYSYSGLCLYSSLLRHRSGNRGRCQYPCRDLFRPAHEEDGGHFPFSMKDLALPDVVPDLANAGVASLKIEGRKKNALYVAAVTRLYRALLDRGMSQPAAERLGDDVRTIFSRPSTELFVHNARNRDTVDPQTVGHRGAVVGRVEVVTGSHRRPQGMRFITQRALQMHDGLQVDLPQSGKPFGFAIETLYVVPAGKNTPQRTVSVPAGARIEVTLPAEHPSIPAGAPVYCSSSQSVKQTYPFHRPKAGAFRVRLPLQTTISVDPRRLIARVSVQGPGQAVVKAEAEREGPFTSARNPHATEKAAQDAFAKLGGTPFEAGSCTVVNPDRLFVPSSVLNTLRRNATARLAEQLEQAQHRYRRELRATYSGDLPASARYDAQLRWSLRVEHIHYLDSLEAADMADVEDVVVDVGVTPAADLHQELDALGKRIGRDRIRLALPLITRNWETAHVNAHVQELCLAGWRRWEAANISAWEFLRDSGGSDANVTCDWPVYVTNRTAAAHLLDLGVDRFVLSPDLDPRSRSELLRRFPAHASVMVYGDPPLFVSETCGIASMYGSCLGKRNCEDRQTLLRSSRGESVIVVQRECRSFLLNDRPLCPIDSLSRLRADGMQHARAVFAYRKYTPQQVAAIWTALRAGAMPPLPSAPRTRTS